MVQKYGQVCSQNIFVWDIQTIENTKKKIVRKYYHKKERDVLKYRKNFSINFLINKHVNCTEDTYYYG